MARKKHQMKMFSSPRETLMASSRESRIRLRLRPVPRRTVDLVADGAVLLHPDSRAKPPPTRGVDPEIEIGVAVEQGADAVIHLHLLQAREEAESVLIFSTRSRSFSRSLSQENRSSVKALK